MPYYFLFENLPAGCPVGPLTGVYQPAKAMLPISEDADRLNARSRLGAFFRRLVRSEWSITSETAVADIGRLLRAAGVLEITCRYDGGNDEGFAHFESASTTHGTKTLDELIALLHGTRLGAVDYDPYATLPKLTSEKGRDWLARKANRTEAQRIGDFIDGFIEGIAVALLGEGFGTGEYAMEGRFRLDLRTASIVDLPMDPPPDFRDSGAFSLDHYYPDEESK
jgi:hypothetical protein